MTDLAEDIARAMVAHVRSMEELLDEEPFLTTTDWLVLPIAKQEVVLRRLMALRAYETIPRPTSADALRSSRDAGVAITRFYQLLSHWRGHDRSPFSLVPHQSLGMERSTRLAAEETATAISASIRKLLRTEPLASTGKVTAHVRRSWKGPGELPTDTALRAFHQRMLRSVDPSPGTLRFNFGGHAQERDVVATRFAETLVVDHVALKGMVAEDDGLPPTVTLVIDLWSGCPLGIVAAAGPPGPGGVVLALEDAARRVAARQDGQSVADDARPTTTIVLATTFAPHWDALVDALVAQGLETIDRRDVSLHQGGPTRRILGMRIGTLQLERRADRSEPFGYDRRVTAVQPLATIQQLLGGAIDGMAASRIPPEAWGTVTPLHVGPLLPATGEEAQRSANGMPSAPPRAGKPFSRRKGLRETLRDLVANRVRQSVRDVRVEEDANQVWTLTVTVDDPASRDALFIDLARDTMRLSAERKVPIVVDVRVADPTEQD